MDLMKHLERICREPAAYMHAPGNERLDTDGVLVLDGVFQKGERICIAPTPWGEQGFLHRHSFIEIPYCLRGGARMEIQGETLELRQGDFCILDMHCAHKILLQPENSLVLTIMVQPDFYDEAFFQHFYTSSPLTAFFAQAVFSQKREQCYILFQTEENSDIRYVFLRMAREFYADMVGSREIMESMLMTLFAESIRLFSQAPERCLVQKAESDLPVFAKIVEYIQANLSTATRQSVATHLGYSYSHVSKVIHAATGYGFNALRNHLRIQKADVLLSNTDLPIEHIAAMAGFSNLTAFYRLFREIHGINPSAFRDNIE